MSNPPTSSIELLKKALISEGFTTRELELGIKKTPYTVLTDKEGNNLLVNSVNPLYPFTTSSARAVSKDKLKAYDLVKTLDIAIPKTRVIDRDDGFNSTEDLLKIGPKFVVKPYDGAGGLAVTVGVDSKAKLESALNDVFEHTNTALVQQQVEGEEIRFLVIKGKVEAAIMRQRPRVVGDGKASVSELIQAENSARAQIKDTLITYPTLTEQHIEAALFSSNDILADGEVRVLGTGTMIKTGASILNVLKEVHSSYITIAEKAAQLFGKGLIVVDVIIKDHTQAATESNYAFIEFNLCPALAMFYSCRDGNHSNVVEDFISPMLQDVIKGPKT